MGVPEAPERAEHPRSGVVRAGWVTVLVGEGVMLAVIGHPLDHGAFHDQRSERRQGIANGGIGLERTVGQQTVKSPP
jgi:hypothetical protein